MLAQTGLRADQNTKPLRLTLKCTKSVQVKIVDALWVNGMDLAFQSVCGPEACFKHGIAAKLEHDLEFSDQKNNCYYDIHFDPRYSLDAVQLSSRKFRCFEVVRRAAGLIRHHCQAAGAGKDGIVKSVLFSPGDSAVLFLIGAFFLCQTYHRCFPGGKHRL